MKKIYILAVIAAIVAGLSVYLFARSLEARTVAQTVDMGTVVLATVDIPANTQITEDMVTLAQMPRQAIHPKAATRLNQVVGAVTRVALTAQEQVLAARLGTVGEGEGALAYALEEGQRAVSVAVDDVGGVSGYLSPGDRVDVLATIIYPSSGDVASYAVSTLLVENVLVLRTGLKEAAATDSMSAAYTTVTLSVTPEQAVRINYAGTNGKVRLVLRPVLDEGSVNVADFPPAPGKPAATPAPGT